ncbi:MAG: hypothetical protein NTW19_22475 [Planctomycetota bacterium]|nr:hypothetical protein [Planctomycetota bacterium]
MTTLALVWNPAIHPALVVAGLALVALPAVISAVRSARSRPRLAVALLVGRLTLIAALGAVLFNPGQSRPHDSPSDPSLPSPDLPRLTVLLDTSTSMLTPDANARPRLARALDDWLRAETLANLRARFNVEIQGFDAQTRPLSDADLRLPLADLARGRQTRLADAVALALARAPHARPADPPSAILLLSDGRTAESSLNNAATPAPSLADVADLARARGVRIHAVAVGSTAAPPALAIIDAVGPTRFVAGETATVRVRIAQRGHDGETISWRVRSENSSTVGSLRLDARATIDLAVSVRAPRQAGPFSYEITLEPPVGSAASGVSRSPAATRPDDALRRWTGLGHAVGRPIRVLFLEGEPAWDSRFFAQALRRDRDIQLTQVTRLGDESVTLAPESPATPSSVGTQRDDDGDDIDSNNDGLSARMPISPREWAAHDVIVLGRSVDRLLDPAAAERLAATIRAGSHLLFLRGRPVAATDAQASAVAASLAPLAPVAWPADGDPAPPASPSPLRATPAGHAHPALQPDALGGRLDDILAGLPGSDLLDPIATVRPAASLLATAGDLAQPAWLTMPVGRGSAALLNGQGWWRWSMLAPEQAGFAPAYDGLMINLVRWLALGGDFAPGRMIDLTITPAHTAPDQEVRFRVASRLPDETALTPRLSVVDPSGTRQEVTLQRQAAGLWTGACTPTKPGIHRALLNVPISPESASSWRTGAIEDRWQVVEDDADAVNPAADPDALRQLALATGGQFIDDAAATDDLRRGLPLLLRASPQPDPANSGGATPRGADEHQSAWDRPWLLALLLGWLGIEWITRRRVGWP